MNNKPLVIYHANCADGFGAAWVFHRYFGDRVDFHPGRYGEAPPDVAGRHVYLVDFSYKREVIERMLQSALCVSLIDHHKTSIDDLAELIASPPANFLSYCSLDHSGAMLAWMCLYGEHTPPPLLLGHIEDRDLWRFKLPHTREIQADVFSHPYDFRVWDRLMAAGQAELLQMTVAGAAIERKHHKDIAELVKVCCRRMTIGGHDVPAASLPYTMTSDAGHLMAHGDLTTPGAPFAACYWDTAEHRHFSLRSTDDGMDVSAIAALYGGGGHRNASGFRVARDHELARA